MYRIGGSPRLVSTTREYRGGDTTGIAVIEVYALP
jgi:hypothetical protein